MKTAAARVANAGCAAGVVLVLSPDHTRNRGLYCKDLSCRPPLTFRGRRPFGGTGDVFPCTIRHNSS